MNTVPFYAPLTAEENDYKKTTDKIALIDADRYKHVVTYRMYQYIQTGQEHSKNKLNEIIDEYLSHDIFNCFEAKTYIFCFSAPSDMTFRNHFAQDKKYKGNRKKDDPNFYTGKYDDMKHIFSYVEQRYETLFYDDLEADDLLSMLQCDETFIYSHDKDLKQVPGFHWDINIGDWVYVSEEKGLKTLFYQILKGDSVDNFVGLRGFGAKALGKLMDENEESSAEMLLYKVIRLYIEKHGVLEGIDTFTEMYSLASMKINRGDYLKEKYSKAFNLINTLNEIED